MAIWHVDSEVGLRNAVAKSAANDTIMVKAGDYHINTKEKGKFDINIDKSLNITGDGGRANFISDGHIVTKGIFNLALDKKETVSFDNIGFIGAYNTDLNGTGIRQNGGNLNVNNSYFENSNNGILSVTRNEDSRGDVHVTNSEFNMAGPNGYSHAMYVLADDFIVEGNNIHDTTRGHHVKSVSANTVVRNNILNDGDGTSSFSVDVSAGGNLLVEGNIITQGVNGENQSIFAYSSYRFGGEAGTVLIRDNIITNMGNGDAGKVLKNYTDSEIKLLNNVIEGFSADKLFSGLFLQKGNIVNDVPLAASSTNANAVRGTALDDIMTISLKSNFQLDAGAGNDTLFGSSRDDLIFGGSGNDFVYGGARDDQIYGQAGNDILLGGKGKDTIYAGAGNDIVFDNNGPNTLWGGAGNDLIYGTAQDQLDGNAGNDIIINVGIGAQGAVLKGGSGNDIIYGLEGADTIHGGKGVDIAVYGGNFASYIVYEEYDFTFLENKIAPDRESDTGKTSERIEGLEMLQFANGYYDLRTEVFHEGAYLFDYTNFMNNVALLDDLTLVEIDAAPLDTVLLLQQVYSSLMNIFTP